MARRQIVTIETLWGPQELTVGFKVYLVLQGHHSEKQKPKKKKEDKKATQLCDLNCHIAAL